VAGDQVDELFADYINRLGCPVPVKRLTNNQYIFGTKKIAAKIINGRLVIRVGGGYMGIEEFMMYYGQQEL
jgi:Growth-Arrest-Specific Protein 2 Domain